MIPTWLIVAGGAVAVAVVSNGSKRAARGGGAFRLVDDGDDDGGDGGDGVDTSDSAQRVKCAACEARSVAYVRRATLAGFGTAVWLRMPPEWTLLLPVLEQLGPEPIHCRCPKHGFEKSTGPVTDGGYTAERLEQIRRAAAPPPMTLEALHRYDITAEVLDASDLSALTAAVFPMLATILAAPMTALIVRPGRVWGKRPTTQVRLEISVLAGGHTIQFEHEYARENIGAIWFYEGRDLGLFGMGG
jgi:hypothetical protein